MWLIVELASASRFELPSNVFLAFHYVNYLFITNPQGQRLFPNSMTTVVQSAVVKMKFISQMVVECGRIL